VFSHEAVREWEAKLTPALAEDLRGPGAGAASAQALFLAGRGSVGGHEAPAPGRTDEPLGLEFLALPQGRLTAWFTFEADTGSETVIPIDLKNTNPGFPRWNGIRPALGANFGSKIR
jgi:hypothetical protein